MAFSSSFSSVAAGLCLLLVVLSLLVSLILFPRETLRWYRLHKYRYEVTTALYICSPAEKFVFNTIVLSLVALVGFATFRYLPTQLALTVRRLVYYLGYSTSIVDVAAANGKDFIRSFARASS